jgi:hypothetical protein
MKMKRDHFILPLMLGIAILIFLPLVWKVWLVSGTVTDANGRPLPGAVVRIKTTNVVTETDANSRFTLSLAVPAFKTHVTAWQDGYYIGGAEIWPWRKTVAIKLTPYTVPDNAEYEWIAPAVDGRSPAAEWLTQTGLGLAAKLSFNRAFLPLSARMALGCRDCHGQSIYDQWAANGHALGAQNPRFLTMYNGTESPLTRQGYNRDYGSFPLRPDLTQAYYGPGYKLDFPATAGNCAACHLPSAAIEQPYGVDPNQATGVDAQAVHCDFCHKIADVKLNPATGLPYENMPGILSIDLMRPGPEPQLFFGPYDDVDVGPDTYLPLMKQSQICAPCHQASFWGVPVYESFSEWQASAYGADDVTCQDCHMKPDGVTTNFAPGRGGQERDPDKIPAHNFPGATDELLLQNAVTLDADAIRQGGVVTVTVTITNSSAGHHVPTDSPLRQMILLVEAKDESGRPYPLLRGPTLPDWTGVGDPSRGNYAGLPGTAYAKILAELWTEVSPTGAYWNPTRLVSDNRIPAHGHDTTVYTFAVLEDTAVVVTARLIFRRAFIDLIEQKGWDAPDIIMVQQSVPVGGDSTSGGS